MKRKPDSNRPNTTRQQVLDLYFLEARHKLIEIAAFLDRVRRAQGPDDFRLEAFRTALKDLSSNKPGLAKSVLMDFSDPTPDPIPAATTKAACGAWPGEATLKLGPEPKH
jgi:hypothetical protein